MLLLNFVVFCSIVCSVRCNVEKVIFIAPEQTTLQNDASIDNLLLVPLNTNHTSVRTYLDASFPTNDQAKGTESWFLLEGLQPGQRYEVRVCWLATQPTAFWLYTHTLPETFETPNLISSLSSYSHKRHSELTKEQIDVLQSRRHKLVNQLTQNSLLFLQIYAAADYYTLNQTLMVNVPPVFVDIILDPYVLNIIPRSLLPIGVHIGCVAIVAWFFSSWIVAHLRRISSADSVTGSQPAEDTEIKKTR